MRVVSWNVNGIRACVRHGFVDFVDRSGADIVGVQEVRARSEDIPAAARRPLGWHTAFTVAERRGYSGVGLYSKLQPVRVDTSLGVPRGVVARIVTGPHDAHRQDPHLSRRYDTGRPRAVIRLRIAQPRTTSRPCPAGLRARRPSPIMDVYRKNVFSTRP